MNRKKNYQFRLTSLFVFVGVASILLAIFWPPSHPPEIRRILRAIPRIPEDSDLQTVIGKLTTAPCKADAIEVGRPASNPIYFIDLENDYRLSLEFQCDVTEVADGTMTFGKHYFREAQVQHLERESGIWRVAK